MAIVRETLVYQGPGGPFEGVIAYDDEVETARPGVLVIPNFLGQKEEDNQTAEKLAALGYVGFACDVFGQGTRTTLDAENPGALIAPLLKDREDLRERLIANLKALTEFRFVDPAKTAVVGFCFGGLCALDMVRSGMDILGAVSLHGVYQKPDYAPVTPMKAKVLVGHGWDDPSGPPEAVVGLAKELTDGGADWQVHAYGHAGHAFTDHDRVGGYAKPGVAYEPKADRRSWQATQNFLAEVFG